MDHSEPAFSSIGRKFVDLQHHMDNSCRRLFQMFGHSVADYPFIYIISSSIVAVALLFGMVFAKGTEMGIDGFTPVDAPSLVEKQVWFGFMGRDVKKIREETAKIRTRRAKDDDYYDDSFGALTYADVDEYGAENAFKYDAGTFQSYDNRQVFRSLTRQFQLFIMARDSGNILRKNNKVNYIREIKSFVSYIENDIIDEETDLAYKDVCENHCGWNHAIQFFLNAFDSIESESLHDIIQLKYPVMEILNRRTFIGANIFGVQYRDSGLVTDARVVSLFFGTTTYSEVNQRAYKRIMSKIYDYIYLDGKKSMRKDFPKLQVHLASYGHIDAALYATSLKMIGYLILCSIFVTSFTCLSTLTAHVVTNKSLFMVLGLNVPLVGTAAAFGLMFYAGHGYNYLCLVTIFLSLGVGVDDMYLMLHAWNRARSTAHSNGKEHINLLTVRDRMGICYAESGPGITITSITNMAAFAISSSSDAPDMRVFCLYTVTSIAVCYVFQLTLFGPMLAIAGRLEYSGRHSVFCWLHVNQQKEKHSNESVYVIIINLVSDFYNRCMKSLVRLYLAPAAKFVLLAVMVVYWIVCAYGLTLFKVEMGADIALSPTSATYDALQVDKKYVAGGAHVLMQFITSPGDLRAPGRVELIMRFFNQVETSNDMMIGRDSTFCWLKPYLDYLSFLGSNNPLSNVTVPFTYTKLPDFFDLSQNAAYGDQLIYSGRDDCRRDRPTCIRGFLCTTGFMNQPDHDQAITELADLRAITKRTEFDEIVPVIYNSRSGFIDQIESLRPQTRLAVIFTFLVMMGVCVLFVLSPWSIAAAGASILSINAGVVGIGQIWGNFLSPVASCGMVMSIGFSVDFTAHITYHYYKHQSTDKFTRLLESLQSVAWPMIQAGVTSGVAAILIIPHGAELILVFSKMMILVVVLGIAHGLVVLPIVLVASPLGAFEAPTVKLATTEDTSHMQQASV